MGGMETNKKQSRYEYELVLVMDLCVSVATDREIDRRPTTNPLSSWILTQSVRVKDQQAYDSNYYVAVTVVDVNATSELSDCNPSIR